MDKYIYNEKNGLWYELQRNYLLPNLTLPEEERKSIGILGQRHVRYLKQYHKVRYYNLLTNGKLNDYLAGICNQAEELFFRLVKQMAMAEGINEQLKAADFMAWVSKMNNIRNRATEMSILKSYTYSKQNDRQGNLSAIFYTALLCVYVYFAICFLLSVE